MKSLAGALLALLIVLPAPAAVAGTRQDLADPALVAVVDGRRYPVRVVDLMYSMAQRGNRQLGYDALVQGLVENQLLAAQALKEFPRNQLLDNNAVGFSMDTQLEDQYLSVLRAYFYEPVTAYVKTLPGGSIDSLLVDPLPANAPVLQQLLRLEHLGEVKLTDAQRALAKKTVLGTARMPDGSSTPVTFLDVYQRENVQGRDRLLQDRDTAYLTAQLKRRVDALFIGWWAREKSGLPADELALVRKLTDEKKLKDGWLMARGVATAMHEDKAAALVQLEAAVTPEEVRAWYGTHKEEFRQVDKVRARHVRCADEAACNKARAELERGTPFADVVRRYSIAPDAKAATPGDLGWIKRKPQGLGWLDTVALIQQPGKPTQPIRSPEDGSGKAVWEIVLVDERVDGYSDPDSETVRYMARQEIARQKAIAGFRAQRDALMANADIRLNGKLVQARLDAAP